MTPTAAITLPAIAVGAKDAAKLIGISPSAVLTLARQDRIPHFRHGKRVLFSVAALTAWVEAQVSA
jgi:excisionase family DNA binding protein